MKADKRIIQLQDIADYVYRSGDLSYKRVYESEFNIEAYLDHEGLEYSFDEPIELELLINDELIMIEGIVTLKCDEHVVVTRDERMGKFLAFMIANKYNIESPYILNVIVDSYGICELEKTEFNYKELEENFISATEIYLTHLIGIEDYKFKRDESLKKLEFPFHSVRIGQNKLLKSVAEVIKKEERLFCKAPTGSGKTLGTIFPSIKSIVNKETKIFYLTAKNEGKKLVQDTMKLLSDSGLVMRCIRLSAKQKMCVRNGKCDLERCSYAKGYFDKFNDAINELLRIGSFYSETVIKQIAHNYHLCPYELSLDLSLYCDIVICDYNHAFDPFSKLKRYFSNEDRFIGNSEYILLIDEAHNLEARSRNMFSADISEYMILDIRKKINTNQTCFSKVLDFFRAPPVGSLRKGVIELEHLPVELIKELKRLINISETYIRTNRQLNLESITEKLFELKRFVSLYQKYDETYQLYLVYETDGAILKLLCVDPAKQIREVLNMAKSTTMFSATLSPINAFKLMLGGNKTDRHLELESPFDANRFKLITHYGISVRYHDRESEKYNIAEAIKVTIEARNGNYLIFASSYAFMETIKSAFQTLDLKDTIIISQSKGDDYKQRTMFVEKFRENEEKNVVGFAVLGGSFSEGLDLKGEALIGTIIVGQGLPPVNLEREYIKNYFDSRDYNGYFLSYRNPGFNKVMQAVGRVIRSEEDKGIAVLIGERFVNKEYLRLYPKEWRNIRYVNKTEQLRSEVNKFWENID